VINWFARNKNVLKDTDQQVKYTRNEEAIHALIGIKIINTIREEHPELFDEELVERIINESQEAFKAESKIIDWMVNGYQEKGLNSEILKEFVKNRINDSLQQIGFPQAFDVDKSLIDETIWFEEELLGNNMTDFFHSRDVSYSKKNQCFDEFSLF
jgi:ribonucleoside-diphosphate reductase beta chain